MRQSRIHDEQEGHVPRKPGGLLWLAVLLLAAVTVFLYLRTRETPESPPVLVPPAEQAPLIRHPLPEATEESKVQPAAPSPLTQYLEAPLPALDDSDSALTPLVAYLVRRPALAELLVSEDRIRRMVVTVDSLTSREVPVNRLPVSLPPGRFLAVQRDDGIYIDPRNHERYARHLELLQQLDTKDLVRAYVHFYPLFQGAYRELGHPQGYFNDRLIEVIDHLLETPVVEQEPRLEQPSLLYVYADSGLENLSAGRKLLLRMGPVQAEAVKGKLRELREALVR